MVYYFLIQLPSHLEDGGRALAKDAVVHLLAFLGADVGGEFRLHFHVGEDAVAQGLQEGQEEGVFSSFFGGHLGAQFGDALAELFQVVDEVHGALVLSQQTTRSCLLTCAL